jgi:hypothetical protein
MKDKLEQIVENNRDALDVYEPRESLWDAIDTQLHKEKKLKRNRVWLAAASLLLMIAITGWLAYNKDAEVTTIVEKGAPEPQNISSELPETYYAKVIESKRNELFTYCSSQPVLCTEFKNDLDTLNARYIKLKDAYNTTADKDVVLQAMMNNLQLQLQILSQQLSIIQQAQNKQTGNDFI